MSEEKTEKATSKKRSDARKEGNVLKSTEVNTAFCAIVMFALMILIWPSLTDKLAAIVRNYLGPVALTMSSEMNVTNVQGILWQMFWSLVSVLLPIIGCAMAAGVAINILQVGFLFTTKTMEPKLSKISPLKGFKRLFSSRSVTELLKSTLKIIILAYIVYTEYSRLLPNFPLYMGQNLYLSFIEIVKRAFTIALEMSVVLGVVAGFDYLYQWWKYEKDLKMTKQEVKDEYKNMEGDPQIKGKIKQKQRQMSAMRMMQKVPSADVVITNPTHFAVALKYEEGKSGAPVVVAKGQGFVALKIKDAAREHKIEIIENKPLAQALYAMCEVGSEIPEEFYQAVADILVYVYRKKNPRLPRAGRRETARQM